MFLLVGKYWHLVRRTATHGIMVVRLSPHTHPATGEARLDVWEVGQLTLVILSGTVDIRLQGALHFQLGICDEICVKISQSEFYVADSVVWVKGGR
jgi:hypothetical protein